MAPRYNSKNPGLFRQLSEPFASTEAANDAVQGFLDEMGALREKYRLVNVLTVIQINVQGEGGEEHEAMLPHMYGDSLRMEGMAAYAYGAAATSRQEAIGQAMKGTLTSRMPQRGDKG